MLILHIENNFIRNINHQSGMKNKHSTLKKKAIKHPFWKLEASQFLWWLSDQNKKHKLCRGPSIKLSHQIYLQLVKKIKM